MKRHVVMGALIFATAIATGCGPRSTWEEFDTRAEAVCSEGNSAMDALGPMPAVGTPGTSAYAIALAGIQARTARRLAELEVPGDERRVSVQLIARLESLAEKSREYAAQIRAGEAALDGAMREAAVEAQNAALDLGLTECARFGLP